MALEERLVQGLVLDLVLLVEGRRRRVPRQPETLLRDQHLGGVRVVLDEHLIELLLRVGVDGAVRAASGCVRGDYLRWFRGHEHTPLVRCAPLWDYSPQDFKVTKKEPALV
tara:strand:+ start:363 stop:695 length:333 start_codon:yes stop_codon:yes gene_type:complete